jgi:TonB family protein
VRLTKYLACLGSALTSLAVAGPAPMPSAATYGIPSGNYVQPAQPGPPQLPLRSTEFAKPVPRPQFVTVQQLDLALDALRQTSWQLSSMFGPLKDLRGRTSAQDVDRWLLTPEHDAQLKELRAKAAEFAAKGAKRDLLLTLNTATGLVAQETYLASVVTAYWSLWSVTAQHIRNMQALATRISPPEPLKDAAFDMIATAVAKDYEHAMTAQQPGLETSEIELLNNDRNNLLHALNEARSRYAVKLSAQQRVQGGGEMPGQPRDTPCPAPVTLTSGAPTPGIAAENAAPEAFYPDSSRRAGYEGSVTVKAWVSATGCAQQASVYTSSGVPELDEAALRWAQQARFRPAERDHQPVDGTLLFAVRFQLHD